MIACLILWLVGNWLTNGFRGIETFGRKTQKAKKKASIYMKRNCTNMFHDSIETITICFAMCRGYIHMRQYKNKGH